MSTIMIFQWDFYFQKKFAPECKREIRVQFGKFLLNPDAKSLDCHGVCSIAGVKLDKKNESGHEELVGAPIVTSPVSRVVRQAAGDDMLIVETMTGCKYCIRSMDFRSGLTHMRELYERLVTADIHSMVYAQELCDERTKCPRILWEKSEDA